MEAQVHMLEVDGSPLGIASMASATLRSDGAVWTVLLHADWDSDIADRFRREGVILEANVELRSDAGAFSSRARLEYQAEPSPGQIQILITGLDELVPIEFE